MPWYLRGYVLINLICSVVHRSVFFTGQIAKQVSGLTSLLDHPDIPVRVAINRDAIHVINLKKNVSFSYMSFYSRQPLISIWLLDSVFAHVPELTTANLLRFFATTLKLQIWCVNIHSTLSLKLISTAWGLKKFRIFPSRQISLPSLSSSQCQLSVNWDFLTLFKVILLGLSYEEFSWDYSHSPDSEHDPECFDTFWLEFDSDESDSTAITQLQIFSKQVRNNLG